MLKILVCGLTICALQANAAASEVPFWRAKPRVYERVQNGDIVVSVRSEKNPKAPPAKILYAGGGGQATVPRAFAFELAQKYAQLPRASEYFKKVGFDAEKNLVTADVEALGYKAHLVLELHPDKSAEPWEIRFLMREGPMPGMSGAITFADLDKLTEFGLRAEYVFETFPMPRMFLEFGLEVILQRAAARLRAYAESEWRAAKAQESAAPKSPVATP